MSSKLGKRKLKSYSPLTYDNDYNELTRRLDASKEDFMNLLKSDYDTTTITEKYIPSWLLGNREEQFKEHFFLLILILKVLPRLNKDEKRKIAIMLEQLEESSISGIFVRQSIKKSINATYESSFNDIYFEQIDFLINHLIKNYNKYKGISLENLNLKPFTNNNNDINVISSPNYQSFQNNKNFISNTAVVTLIKQLNEYD